jgi:hypothetical protein
MADAYRLVEFGGSNANKKVIVSMLSRAKKTQESGVDNINF